MLHYLNLKLKILLFFIIILLQIVKSTSNDNDTRLDEMYTAFENFLKRFEEKYKDNINYIEKLKKFELNMIGTITYYEGLDCPNGFEKVDKLDGRFILIDNNNLLSKLSPTSTETSSSKSEYNIFDIYLNQQQESNNNIYDIEILNYCNNSIKTSNIGEVEVCKLSSSKIEISLDLLKIIPYYTMIACRYIGL